jgi:TRAP-type uncharacterized transport system fused permease subunit
VARSQSVFLTAVVSMVLGIVIGVVGLTALANALTQNAADVAREQSDESPTAPEAYGSR